jgi:hypothetical protein
MLEALKGDVNEVIVPSIQVLPHVLRVTKHHLNHFEIVEAAVDLYELGAGILWADVQRGWRMCHYSYELNF